MMEKREPGGLKVCANENLRRGSQFSKKRRDPAEPERIAITDTKTGNLLLLSNPRSTQLCYNVRNREKRDKDVGKP